MWREEIINYSKDFAKKDFTHGVAAKLINIYLKEIIICGGFHDHPHSTFIHPPIDSTLLKELANHKFNNNAKFWRRSNIIAWSNFDSEYYQKVISEIRNGLKGEPMWKIEFYWKGHQ